MAYLFLDGVWLKVRRTFGPQRVLLLVAYGVQRDDQRSCWHSHGPKGAEETIERCFVEVRRRTRPMVFFTNVASVERIIYAIFSRFN